MYTHSLPRGLQVRTHGCRPSDRRKKFPCIRLRLHGWWCSSRYRATHPPRRLAHAQHLHQVRVAELIRLALQPLLPLHGVFDLLGTLLLLVLQSSMGILKGLDPLQQITPPLHGGCRRSPRTARLRGCHYRRGGDGTRCRRRVDHTGLGIRGGTSDGVGHGADTLTNKPKGSKTGRQT